VCNHSGHPDQIKGYQFGPINEWSEKTKELVDRLVGEEIDNAYKRATNMLRENSDLHNILIDALLKYESLGSNYGTNFLRRIFVFLQQVTLHKLKTAFLYHISYIIQ